MDAWVRVLPGGDDPSKESSLDLLIISHLVEDHVNGIPRLLDKTHVRFVMLPYFNEDELLVAVARSRSDNPRYLEFLADPVTYLASRIKDKVVIVRGQGEGGPREYSEDDFKSPAGEQSSREPRRGERLPPFSEKSFETLRNDDTIKGNLSQWSSFLELEKLQTKSDAGFLDLADWRFWFYVHPPDPKALNHFSNAAKQIVGTRTLQQVLANSDVRKRLRECYRALASAASS